MRRWRTRASHLSLARAGCDDATYARTCVGRRDSELILASTHNVPTCLYSDISCCICACVGGGLA